MLACLDGGTSWLSYLVLGHVLVDPFLIDMGLLIYSTILLYVKGKKRAMYLRLLSFKGIDIFEVEDRKKRGVREFLREEKNRVSNTNSGLNSHLSVELLN